MEQHITLSMVELSAAIVGLITGVLYTYLRLPIPAPPVLGGIFAVVGTWLGLTIVQLIRGQVTFF